MLSEAFVHLAHTREAVRVILAHGVAHVHRCQAETIGTKLTDEVQTGLSISKLRFRSMVS